MIVLLDTCDALDVCAAELGCEVKQLITPAPGYRRQKEHDEFAIDNGAFSGFNEKRFLAILEREREVKHLCRFVAVPDVVGCARRTCEVFRYWRHRLACWPLAFVAQDGIENLEIPWKGIAAVFIGGSTEWKLSQHAVHVIRTAQAMGKYIHVGRVNTPARFEYFEKLGADSIDGTGLAQYTWMRTRIYDAIRQPTLLHVPVLDAETCSSQQRQSMPTAEPATPYGSTFTESAGNASAVGQIAESGKRDSEVI